MNPNLMTGLRIGVIKDRIAPTALSSFMLVVFNARQYLQAIAEVQRCDWGGDVQSSISGGSPAMASSSLCDSREIPKYEVITP
jgi:hypothetical protein